MARSESCARGWPFRAVTVHAMVAVDQTVKLHVNMAPPLWDGDTKYGENVLYHCWGEVVSDSAKLRN